MATKGSVSPKKHRHLTSRKHVTFFFAWNFRHLFFLGGGKPKITFLPEDLEEKHVPETNSSVTWKCPLEFWPHGFTDGFLSCVFFAPRSYHVFLPRITQMHRMYRVSYLHERLKMATFKRNVWVNISIPWSIWVMNPTKPFSIPFLRHLWLRRFEQLIHNIMT